MCPHRPARQKPFNVKVNSSIWLLLGRGKNGPVKSEQSILFDSRDVHGVLVKGLVTERKWRTASFFIGEAVGDIHSGVIIWGLCPTGNDFLSEAKGSERVLFSSILSYNSWSLCTRSFRGGHQALALSGQSLRGNLTCWS